VHARQQTVNSFCVWQSDKRLVFIFYQIWRHISNEAHYNISYYIHKIWQCK